MLASALLGESPPSMPVRRLVRLAGLFGINENQARVALSRMAARGEVVADGQGTYALSGRLLERSSRLAAARSAATGDYDGTWHVVVVTDAAGSSGLRRRRRDALRAARLGELRDAVWVRPANLVVSLEEPVASAVARFSAAPQTAPVALAAASFDLEGWARRASALLGALDATPTSGDDALAAGFVRSAEVLRHLQRDPLLPAELLPARWPGAALRARYDEFDEHFRRLLADAHRAAAVTPAR